MQERSGRPCSPRFTPAARHLREVVADGVLGRVFLASVTVKEDRAPGYFLDSPWRGRKAEAGGGVLMIQAIHMIDLLLWVLGMPRRVVGHTRTVVDNVEVEDVAVGLLEFEGGVIAALQATTGAVPEQPPSVDIHGDRGTATVTGCWGISRSDCAPVPNPVVAPAEGHVRHPLWWLLPALPALAD